jgi:hypothetical protein
MMLAIVAMVQHKPNAIVVNIIKFLMVIFVHNHVIKMILIKMVFADPV